MVNARSRRVPRWGHGSASQVITYEIWSINIYYKPRDFRSPPPPDIMPGELPPLPLTMSSQPDSASSSLKEIADWDGTSQAIYEVLATAFGARDYLDCIKNLKARGIDPGSYIDNLDKVSPRYTLSLPGQLLTVWPQIIEGLPVDSDLRRRCLRALRKTCGLYGIIPTSYTITQPLSKPGPRAFASGGFSDVWRLTHQHNPNMTFAVKSLRVYEKDPVEKINKVRSSRQTELACGDEV